MGSGVLRQRAAGRLAALAALRLIARDAERERNRGFDLPGALSATTGITLLVFALIQGPEFGWGSPLIVASAAAGLLSLGALTIDRAAKP